MPNRQRARQLKDRLDQLYLDLEEARQDDAPGSALFVHDLLQAIHETQHALFLTGVSE